MTEAEGAAEPKHGTGAHYLHFLNWAEKKGELPATTVQNWRNASVKVLEIEDDWQNLNLVEFDLDGHLNRFEILKRTAYAASSMNAYKARTKIGIETYRAWLAQAPDWKSKAGAPRVSKNGSEGKSAKKTASTPPETMVPTGDIGGYVPTRRPLIEYPFPLGPGVQARITLPEDLTDKEAKRIARFVESLAFTEQLAITGSPAGE